MHLKRLKNAAYPLAFVLSCAFISAVSASSDQATTNVATVDWEEVYLKRLERLRKSTLRGGGLQRYDPTVAVRGARIIQPITVAATPPFSKEAIAKADHYAAERNSSALIIWQGGEISFEKYYGDVKQDTPLVSKSLAKPLTALLVGRAISQGKIKSLEQPAADFITEWQDVDGKSEITLHHLLSMRSGLIAQGFSTDPQSIWNRAYLHPRHDEIIINEYPLVDKPGSVYQYSNSNAELIAPILQRATGQTYADYVSSALLEPLGAAGGEVWVNRSGGTAHSGCCIMLPARTWVKMAILIQQNGVWDGQTLLPSGYAKAMLTATKENVHHGMGVWVAGPYVKRRGSANPSILLGRTYHSEPYADADLSLFDGNSNQVVYMIPSQNMVILRTGGDTPDDKPWDNAFLPNLLIRDYAAMTKTRLPVPQRSGSH